jgi:hypothetical protein
MTAVTPGITLQQTENIAFPPRADLRIRPEQGRVWGRKSRSRREGRVAEKGGNASFPICPVCDAPGLKAVIYCLKRRHSTPRLFQRYRWQLKGQRSIVVDEGLPLLGAEDHRMDVEAWLQDLGLERYAPAFHDNEIDERVLPSLTAEDLKDLGVTLVGHRRRLLDAIAALGAALLQLILRLIGAGKNSGPVFSR